MYRFSTISFLQDKHFKTSLLVSSATTLPTKGTYGNYYTSGKQSLVVYYEATTI